MFNRRQYRVVSYQFSLSALLCSNRHRSIHQLNSRSPVSSPSLSVLVMPSKATGKRKTASTDESAPSTPAQTRQRRTEPASDSSSTVTPIASSTSSSSSPGLGLLLLLQHCHWLCVPSQDQSTRQLSSYLASRHRPFQYEPHTLHRIMQALFDWCDSHKHQFALPAADYPSNSPIDSILWDPTSRRFRDGTIVLETWDDVDACHEDERAVTVGELLPTVKARLVYGYDFGDSWDHQIRVESIEPAVQAQHE